MNLSRKWLTEFVDVGEMSDRDFAEAMTLSGSKVEGTTDLGAEIRNVVVGKILSMERHPDSDHMWICQIDVGEAEPIQIVTGAWNVHEGDLLPVAKHNSLLPGGKKITKGKLRGVPSAGMLCTRSTAPSSPRRSCPAPKRNMAFSPANCAPARATSPWTPPAATCTRAT